MWSAPLLQVTCHRDMAEIWPKYGREVADISPRLSHTDFRLISNISHTLSFLPKLCRTPHSWGRAAKEGHKMSTCYLFITSSPITQRVFDSFDLAGFMLVTRVSYRLGRLNTDTVLSD